MSQPNRGVNPIGALVGIGSQGDSGVTARLFGEFLTWLNDRSTGVFVVATSNDIAKLPQLLAGDLAAVSGTWSVT